MTYEGSNLIGFQPFQCRSVEDAGFKFVKDCEFLCDLAGFDLLGVTLLSTSEDEDELTDNWAVSGDEDLDA